MNTQFGKDVAWRTAHAFFRASMMFTMTLIVVLILVAVVLILWGIAGLFLGSGIDFSGLRITIGTWSAITLGALGIGIPFAAYNGLGQGIWAALTYDDLDPSIAERVFSGRALMINFLGLPLLLMLIVWGISGTGYHLFSAGVVGLFTAVPAGMVAYTAVPNVASWYRKSTYAIKRKRKSYDTLGY